MKTCTNENQPFPEQGVKHKQTTHQQDLTD